MLSQPCVLELWLFVFVVFLLLAVGLVPVPVPVLVVLIFVLLLLLFVIAAILLPIGPPCRWLKCRVGDTASARGSPHMAGRVWCCCSDGSVGRGLRV